MGTMLIEVWAERELERTDCKNARATVKSPMLKYAKLISSVQRIYTNQKFKMQKN